MSSTLHILEYALNHYNSLNYLICYLELLTIVHVLTTHLTEINST